MAIPVETFFLDERTEGTLQSRIQQMIAQGILSGRFRKGEKLPSTRKLAAHLGISRITVTLAYTELQANDYLASRGRSGFFVSQNAPQTPKFSPADVNEDAVDWHGILHDKFTETFLEGKPRNWSSYKYPFIYGQVDQDLFDHANWRFCALRALGSRDFKSMAWDLYDQDDPMLLEFVARHTLPRRGISAREDQILITLGAQNALWLAAQVLLRQGSKVAVENPCYPALLDILSQSHCSIDPIDVDEYGLMAQRLGNDTNVVFVTPSHHCPTAATMPLERRKKLLQKARELGALIVEDDYEFEMSFLAPALPALKSLDRDGRVIYVGSFSKSLFPGLRLGYMVGAAPFIARARALRSSILRHPPGHIQRTAAYFLSLGHYDALIKRMSKHFAQRHVEMEKALKRHGLEIAGKADHGGSSFWIKAPKKVDSLQLSKDLRKKSVLIEPGHPFFVGNSHPTNYIRLAYSSIGVDKIKDGVGLIAEAIDNFGPNGLG